MVDELIDIHPLDIGPNDKDKKTSGIYSGWLTTNFHTCPEGANDGTVWSRGTLVLGLWHMVVGFLFLTRAETPFFGWCSLSFAWSGIWLSHTTRGRQHLVGSIERYATIVAETERTQTLEVVRSFYNFGCGSNSLSVDHTGLYLRYDLFSTTFIYTVISLVLVCC
jgi:hypothetical protein